MIRLTDIVAGGILADTERFQRKLQAEAGEEWASTARQQLRDSDAVDEYLSGLDSANGPDGSVSLQLSGRAANLIENGPEVLGEGLSLGAGSDVGTSDAAGLSDGERRRRAVLSRKRGQAGPVFRRDIDGGIAGKRQVSAPDDVASIDSDGRPERIALEIAQGMRGPVLRALGGGR